MIYKDLLSLKNPIQGQIEEVIDETYSNQKRYYIFSDDRWVCCRQVNYQEAWNELKLLVKNNEIKELIEELENKHNSMY